jgi:hypothetical protein
MHYFVNCWHINDSENRIMWRLYSPAPESVVVVSRAGLLTLYARSCRHYGLWALTGKVKYVAYDYTRPDWLSYGPAFFKDLPYRFEHEYRLVISDDGSVHFDFLRYSLDSTALIEKVILHPHASTGFSGVVRSLMRRELPHVPVLSSAIKSHLW